MTQPEPRIGRSGKKRTAPAPRKPPTEYLHEIVAEWRAQTPNRRPESAKRINRLADQLDAILRVPMER